MAGRLLLLFIILPLAETWLLIQVGSVIGALATIGLVILTAVIGSQLVRWQGLQTVQEIQACQRRGEMPAIPMLEGGALLLAGAFLITPGFISDSLGFLLLIPPLRRQVARRLLGRVIVMPGAGGKPPEGGAPANADNNVIEGDYRRDE